MVYSILKNCLGWSKMSFLDSEITRLIWVITLKCFMSGQDYLNIWVKQWLWHSQVSIQSLILIHHAFFSIRYIIKSKSCHTQPSPSRRNFEIDSGRFRRAQVPALICGTWEKFELSTFERRWECEEFQKVLQGCWD